MVLLIRLGDGIGRHTGLKILSPQGRAGSIPALGIFVNSLQKGWRIWILFEDP